MGKFLLTFAIIFILVAGWIIVQQWSRKFAARHPELGNFREEGSGCGGCACGTAGCKKHNEPETRT